MSCPRQNMLTYMLRLEGHLEAIRDRPWLTLRFQTLDMLDTRLMELRVNVPSHVDGILPLVFLDRLKLLDLVRDLHTRQQDGKVIVSLVLQGFKVLGLFWSHDLEGLRSLVDKPSTPLLDGFPRAFDTPINR